MSTAPSPPASAPPIAKPRRRGVPARWIVGGLALLAISSGTLFAMTRGSDAAAVDAASDTNVEWYTVAPRSFDLTVTESGDLDAAQRLEIKSKVEGRPVIISLVEEGARVKAGDVLVRLDTEALQTKIEETVLQVEKARTDEIFARRGLEIERNEAKSTQAAAEVELALAELELAKWKQGDVPQTRRELNLALQKAQRQVERAQRDFAISQELYDRKFISLNDLEDSEIDQLDAADALQTAELELAVYNDYTYQTEEQQKRSAVEQARADLEKITAKNASELDRLSADLDGKRQTLTIREERLRKLNDQYAASTIVAPRDGVVIYGTSVGRGRWRGDPMAEGRQVRYNETILFLPDVSEMIANLSVAEAYEPLVRTGQTVRVTVDARPGEVFEGVVERTTPLTESGGWLNPGQREFTARVTLPGANEADLSPAMRCTGEITVGHVEDALAVPVQAVFTEADQHFCYVPAPGGYVAKRDLDIGRASESLVEITDGLAAGDRVLLRNPRPGEVRQQP
ncbi:MAG: HlyD family efflux transporter periplasmic adaptor subunit [Planctomycetota bacterium]